MKKTEIKKIAVSAIIIALAFVVTMLTAPFKVQFLSLDLKDAILSVISLLFGPYYGVISVIAVSLLEFITISSTGWYGLVMNIISSGTFALTIGFIYKYKRSFSGAIIAATCTVFAVTAVMLLANIFVTPFYLETVVGVPASKEVVRGMLPTVLLPFNLCKALMNSAFTLLIYKPFTTALKKCGLVEVSSSSQYKFNLKTALLTVISLIIVICVLLYMVIILKLGVQA